jgi:NAD(P)-dependent dehydrogenase (short-subunit alcohol dehydrogenase family)
LVLLDGKAGLVTGAASGIGRASAICFAREGAAVVVADLESQRGNGEETVRLIEQAAGRAVFVATDVSNEDDQRRAVHECVARFGALDFAHNNAGRSHRGTVEETTAEDWAAVIDVNLTGVWMGMKHQLQQMRQQGSGSIVNTASMAGLLGVPGRAAYIASKFGVVGLTKAAALEAADAGIRVNCVCPSIVETPMVGQLTPSLIAGATVGQAIKRVTQPAEVAETVVWLASERAALLTGAALTIDLGATAGFAPVAPSGTQEEM